MITSILHKFESFYESSFSKEFFVVRTHILPDVDGMLKEACSVASVVSDSLVILWTVAHQAPLSMGFSRWEYWSGLPLPSPGDLPNQGKELKSRFLYCRWILYPLSQLGSHWRKPITNCQCLCILNFLIKTSEDYNRIQVSPRQTSLEVQWLRCYTSTPRGRGSVPCWGTKIPNAIWCGQENFKT